MGSDYEKYIDELIRKRLSEALGKLETDRSRKAAQLDDEAAAARTAGENEKRGAYGDYVKNIDPYGVNSEQRAALGLAKSGKSETARANYYNVYQNALSSIGNNTAGALSDISSRRAALESDFEAGGTKARTEAYNSLLEEYIRRKDDEKDAAELAFKKEQAAQEQQNWERQFEKTSAKASSGKSTASSSTKKSTTKSDASAIVGKTQAGASDSYPYSGTDRQKYNWFKKQLNNLRWSVLPGEDNPHSRIKAAENELLDWSRTELSDNLYFELYKLTI